MHSLKQKLSPTFNLIRSKVRTVDEGVSFIIATYQVEKNTEAGKRQTHTKFFLKFKVKISRKQRRCIIYIRISMIIMMGPTVISGAHHTTIFTKRFNEFFYSLKIVDRKLLTCF